MGVLRTVLDVFSPRDVVDCGGEVAAGSAADGILELIGDLRETRPDEVRSAEGERGEFVIRRARLEEYDAILRAALGEACKPFGARVRFAPALASRIEAIGGIRPEQCLYLRRFADDRIVYAALWPWGDPSALTLKVGVFEAS